MKLLSISQKLLFPAPVVTLYYLTKYRCKISPKAEVELSPFLTIGKNTVISSFTKIKATYGSLNIGANVLISTGCFIGAGEGCVRIGDNCMIGPNTSIIGNSYKYDKVDVPIQEQGITSKGIKIKQCLDWRRHLCCGWNRSWKRRHCCPKLCCIFKNS